MHHHYRSKLGRPCTDALLQDPDGLITEEGDVCVVEGDPGEAVVNDDDITDPGEPDGSESDEPFNPFYHCHSEPRTGEQLLREIFGENPNDDDPAAD